MKLITSFSALALVLVSGPALAENWVTVIEHDNYVFDVDKDSIRRGSDNLIYFQTRHGDKTDLVDSQSSQPGKTDRAADCQKKVLYKIKVYVRGSEDPDWRNNASPVAEPGTMTGTILQYVCDNA